jgi:hypothetical protein
MVSETDVKEHYGKLAADYGVRANRTLEQTYFRWPNGLFRIGTVCCK